MKRATLIAATLLWNAPALAQDATQVIEINAGWNSIAFNVIPENADIAAVVADHADEIIAIKNTHGDVYLTEYNFNGIGELQLGEGYQLVATNSFNLVVTGEQANPGEDYFLNVGWNTIGSTLTHDIPADCFAQFIASHADGFQSVQIKDNEGNDIWLGTFSDPYASAIGFPSTTMTYYGFTTINAGKGYMVNIVANDGLTFSWAHVTKTCKSTEASTGSRNPMAPRR